MIGIKLTVLYVLKRVVGILICHSAIVAPVSSGSLKNAVYLLSIGVIVVITSVESGINVAILSAGTLRKLNVRILAASACLGKIILLYNVSVMRITVSIIGVIAVETGVGCGIAVLTALTVEGKAYLILMRGIGAINVGIIVKNYAFANLYAIGIIGNVLAVFPNGINIASNFKAAILTGFIANFVRNTRVVGHGLISGR